MKKVKKILLGLSIPAAALAMSVGSMVTTPTEVIANPGGGFDCAGDCAIVCGDPETPCSAYLCGEETYLCFGPN